MKKFSLVIVLVMILFGCSNKKEIDQYLVEYEEYKIEYLEISDEYSQNSKKLWEMADKQRETLSKSLTAISEGQWEDAKRLDKELDKLRVEIEGQQISNDLLKEASSKISQGLKLKQKIWDDLHYEKKSSKEQKQKKLLIDEMNSL